MISIVFAELTGTGGGIVAEVLAWAGETRVICGLAILQPHGKIFVSFLDCPSIFVATKKKKNSSIIAVIQS